MPIFDEGGNTGASKQNAWEALSGLFDDDRKGKPDPQKQEDEDDGDEKDKKKKKTGKWF